MEQYRLPILYCAVSADEMGSLRETGKFRSSRDKYTGFVKRHFNECGVEYSYCFVRIGVFLGMPDPINRFFKHGGLNRFFRDGDENMFVPYRGNTELLFWQTSYLLTLSTDCVMPDVRVWGPGDIQELAHRGQPVYGPSQEMTVEALIGKLDITARQVKDRQDYAEARIYRALTLEDVDTICQMRDVHWPR